LLAMKVMSVFLLFVASAAAQGGNDDDDDFKSQGGGGGAYGAAAEEHAEPAYQAPAEEHHEEYHAPVRAAAVYHAPIRAAAPAYHAPMAAAYAAPVAEFHIHPACNSGGPTPGYGESVQMEAHGGYRNLRNDRTLFEDDLEEPFDDPGCGHGVCVLAPGGHGECICDASFMTTEDSGPCGQHQKSQGVAFLLQLFLGPFGAGGFYLGGGWIAGAIICLLFGGLGMCIAPILACIANGVFDFLDCVFCDCLSGPNPMCGATTVTCCWAVLHCAALITWFVTLIIIGVDCKVGGIPCVPM